MSKIDSLDDLLPVLEAAGIELNINQKKWFETAGIGRSDYLRFQTTASYLEKAVRADTCDRGAILKQIIPDVREFEVQECELKDPLGEHKFSPFPGLIHRYPDRALILVTDRCDMYCRHCFRRSFSSGGKGSLSREELAPMTDYIASHSEISEVLLTGGDPLTVPDSRLLELIRGLKTARPDLVIRLCSRIPVVNPERITDKLTEALGVWSGIWFVTHFNHPAELAADSCAAVKRLVKAGIPVLNQTVLLRGVNDSVETLKRLFQKLLQHNVKPYYLFQGDLAAGTSHLRVPLSEALELTRELKDHISGAAMPRFAVDLPGGGGKVTLPSQSEPARREGDYYVIKGFDNEDYRYPAN